VVFLIDDTTLVDSPKFAGAARRQMRL